MELPAAGLAVDPLALLLGDLEAAAGLGRYRLESDAEVVGQLRRLGERAGDPHAGAAFLGALLPLLAEAPDPAAALRHLEFWSAHLPTPATTLAALRDHPRLLADLLHLLSLGSYLTVTLAREPGLYALLLEPAGVLRLVVDNPVHAAGVLRERHYEVSERDALVVEVPNEPGSFAAVGRLLAGAGINLDYAYATARDDQASAVVVVGVPDALRASAAAGL